MGIFSFLKFFLKTNLSMHNFIALAAIALSAINAAKANEASSNEGTIQFALTLSRQPRLDTS
jgi:hypothetical protein